MTFDNIITCKVCGFKDRYSNLTGHFTSELHKDAVYRKKYNLPDEPTCCECEDCVVFYHKGTDTVYLICEVENQLRNKDPFPAELPVLDIYESRNYIESPSFCWKRKLM